MRLRWLCAISMVLLTSVSGCASKKTVDEPSPYKEGNYPGNLKIGNPYDIDGRTYIPSHEPDYVEEGMASWYGPGFHGRSTANGERFDQNALTAAHRTLPMPSMVRVTNLENGKQAVLKVNDRGPFKKDRIIDLSKGAAKTLGVIDNGTAMVRVEYLPDETRKLISDLVQNNQLKATGETLAALGMQDLQPGAVMTDAVPAAPAMADAGVESRAPLAPVASRSVVAAPSQPARAAQRSGEQKIVVAYQEDVVPSVMPTTEEGRAAYRQTSTARVSTTAQPKPATPMDLPPLPMNAPAQQQAYVPTPAPQIAAPMRPAVQQAAPAVASGIYVQAGSFSQELNAHKLSQKLSHVGRTVVKPADVAGRTWYRVQVGPLADMGNANAALQQLHAMGIQDARILKD